MKLKLIILFLSFSFSSIIFGMEPEVLKIEKQLSNIEELPKDVQLHIISFLISKIIEKDSYTWTIKQGIQYLKNLYMTSKSFNFLINQNIDFIIEKLSVNYAQDKISVALMLAKNGFIRCINNCTKKLKNEVMKCLLYQIMSKQQYDYEKTMEILNKIAQQSSYIHENLEAIILILTEFFHVNALEVAKRIQTTEVRDWVKNSSKKLDNDTVRIAKINSFYRDIFVVAKTHDNTILKEELIRNTDDGECHSIIRYDESLYKGMKWIDLKKRDGKWDKIEFYNDGAKQNLINTYCPSGNTRNLTIVIKDFTCSTITKCSLDN